MKRGLQVCLFVFALIRCGSFEATNENAALVKDHSVMFPLDESTSYRTFYIEYLQGKNGDQLMFLNHLKPSILFYDWKTQAMLKEIVLQEDGPDGVGSVSGLVYKSPDSIYVVSSSRYTVSLVDSAGSVKKRYRLLAGSSYNENTGMLRPYTISPGTLIGDSLYFNVAPDRNVYDPSYYDGFVNIAMDVKSGGFRYFNTYPSEFKVNGVWGVAAIDFSTAFNPVKNHFIYSFAVSDSITVLDIATGKIKRYYAGSDYQSTSFRPMDHPDNEHDLEYALNTTYYGAVIYDRFRDVYYRLVRHSMPYKDDATGQPNDFHEKPLSVIVLNNNFERITEARLEDDKYLPTVFFVGPDGLFLSEGNPSNKKFDEDFASFSCITFAQQ